MLISNEASKSQNRVVLVTGGAGYIGSHACKELHSHGYVPVTVDNFCTGNREAVKWGPLYEVDIRDQSGMSAVFSEVMPSAVMHFAASAYVGESVLNPRKYYDNNVQGLLALLEVMTQASVNKLVFSSSCATYGVPESELINEAHPQNPINPYGRTKLICEQIIQDYSSAHNFQFALLRYFNAAGADRDLEVGEIHDPEPHVIPLAISAALNGGYFYLNGSNHATRDGTPVRDYIHVSDLASAHVRALRKIMDGGDNISVNLGSGIGTSVSELLKVIEAITDGKLTVVEKGKRAGDPAYLVADISYAKKTLGWTPLHSSIENIVSTAVRWHVDGNF